MIPNKNTFCIAPFKHACIHPTGKLSVCCASSDVQNYDYTQIEEWYKSKQLEDLRQDLLTGKRNKICRKCWTDEDNGKESQREIYNMHLGRILSKQFDKSIEKSRTAQDAISNRNIKSLTTFDLKLGNHCNLKCIMCSPTSSSELLLEAKKNKQIAKYYNIPDSKDFIWAKSKQFKEWCENYLKDATYLKFTGGEPFLNPYLLTTLNKISRDQRKKCILQFTTNLTVINQNIIEILNDFKEVWLCISMEGVKDTLEYARYGHKWDDFEKNIKLVKKLSKKNFYLSIAHVVQSPTFADIKNLINYCDKEELEVIPIFLTQPIMYTLQSIKTKYKQELIEDLSNYKGFNKLYVKSLINFLSINLNYDHNLAKLCVKRLEDFDRVRGLDFKKIINLDYFI